jgi:hypothetical protein
MCPCCGSRSPGLFPRRWESGNMDFLFLRSGFPLARECHPWPAGAFGTAGLSTAREEAMCFLRLKCSFLA